jgi:hypothetical protein
VAAVTAVVALPFGCSKENETVVQSVALAGQWTGKSDAGEQQLTLALWGDRRYEWRQHPPDDADALTVAHHGTWRVTSIEREGETVYVVALSCESTEAAARESVATGEHEIRIAEDAQRRQRRIESPWGRFNVVLDSGA